MNSHNGSFYLESCNKIALARREGGGSGYSIKGGSFSGGARVLKRGEEVRGGKILFSDLGIFKFFF